MIEHRLVAPEKGAYPFTPFVQFVLSSYSTDSAGCPCLSAQLMTEREIDERIQSLKDNLDRVGNLAKRALRRVHPGAPNTG